MTDKAISLPLWASIDPFALGEAGQSLLVQCSERQHDDSLAGMPRIALARYTLRLATTVTVDLCVLHV